jgi:hypothetical protein
MRLAFLTLIVAALPFALVMSRKPPTESLSCLSMVNSGELCEFKTCPPCWEQSQWSSNFYKQRGLSTIGTCHRLHPSTVEGWKAIKPDGKYWSSTKWKGLLVANGKNHYLFYRVDNIFLIVLTQPFTSEEDLPPKKRHRKPADHFKPSRDVKTNVEMLTSYGRNAKWKRDRAQFESEPDLSNLVNEMKMSLPRKLINETILAPLLAHAAETKDGRYGIAKAISKKAKLNLPTGGNSKSALNRAKQTAGHLMGGLATILDPDNPDRL